MDKEITKKRVKNKSTVITLGLGIFIGSILAATFIGIYEDKFPLLLGKILSGLILLSSVLFIVFWIKKRKFFYSITGLPPKELPELVLNISQDIKNKNYTNIDAYAYQLTGLWSVLQARKVFVGLVVYLSTAIFLMLGSYVGLQQIEKIEEEIKLIDTRNTFSRSLEISQMKVKHFSDANIRTLQGHIEICSKEIPFKFNYIQINKHLSFYELFYELYKNKTLSLEEINHHIGKELITMFYDKNISDYIELGRKSDPKWYSGIEELAKKLVNISTNKMVIDNLIKKGCLSTFK